MRSNSSMQDASTSSNKIAPAHSNKATAPFRVDLRNSAIVFFSMFMAGFSRTTGKAMCEEFDLPLSTTHPLVVWYQHQPLPGKIPNAKTNTTPMGTQVVFSPIGSKGTAVTAGFDYRLASDGDFYFALESVFHVPKDEEGGSLILAIPFNSPDEGRLSVSVFPSNKAEKQVLCTARYASKSGVSKSIEPIVANASKGLIEVERSGSQVVVRFTPNPISSSSNTSSKGGATTAQRIQSDPIEVPNAPIRPISLWMRCSPKSSVVKYDLIRFKARTDRTPASLSPTTQQIDWVTWCTVGFLALGIAAGAIKLFGRPKEQT